MTSSHRQFRALTQAQFNALGNVAFGGHGAGCSRRTLQALERRGLVVAVERVDGNFRWNEWEVELPVHIAFCEYCASIADELATSEHG